MAYELNRVDLLHNAKEQLIQADKNFLCVIEFQAYVERLDSCEILSVKSKQQSLNILHVIKNTTDTLTLTHPLYHTTHGLFLKSLLTFLY